jgi:hypothetical protein
MTKVSAAGWRFRSKTVFACEPDPEELLVALEERRRAAVGDDREGPVTGRRVVLRTR